jgi:hypothetical protein
MVSSQATIEIAGKSCFARIWRAHDEDDIAQRGERETFPGGWDLDVKLAACMDRFRFAGAHRPVVVT